MPDTASLADLTPITRPSVADQVYDVLRQQILALRLPPGAKLSEVDVAQHMNVSRQPVRDAFYRLSQLGFLTIRPQRVTTVALISSEAVMQARFIRSAIEAETMRIACQRLTDADHRALERVLAKQKLAVDAKDRDTFHELDDEFHRQICNRAGCGFAWTLIQEQKAHMDRVRLLSLSFGSGDAYGDHLEIMEALRRRDAVLAMDAMRRHLGRIKQQILRIRADNRSFFVTEEADQPDL